MDAKAAYHQASEIMSAGVRRLKRAQKFLNDNDPEAAFLLFEATQTAEEALDRVRRLERDAEQKSRSC